jgi:hypothetical protein
MAGASLFWEKSTAGWFVVREKYCWLVADKPSEQGDGSEMGRPRRQRGDEVSSFFYWQFATVDISIFHTVLYYSLHLILDKKNIHLLNLWTVCYIWPTTRPNFPLNINPFVS